MIVSKRDGSNLHEAVQQGVAVHIANVVAVRLLVVSEECDGGHFLHGVQLLLQLQGLWAGDSSADVDGGFSVMDSILKLSLDYLLLGLVSGYRPVIGGYQTIECSDWSLYLLA